MPEDLPLEALFLPELFDPAEEAERVEAVLALPPLFLLVVLPARLLAPVPELPEVVREFELEDEPLAAPFAPDFVVPDLEPAAAPDLFVLVLAEEGADPAAADFVDDPAVFAAAAFVDPELDEPDFEVFAGADLDDLDEAAREDPALDDSEPDLLFVFVAPFDADEEDLLLPPETPAVFTTAVAVPTAAPLAAPSAAP